MIYRYVRYAVKGAHTIVGLVALVWFVYSLPHYADASFYRAWRPLTNILDVVFCTAGTFYFGKQAVVQIRQVRTTPSATSYPWVVRLIYLLGAGWCALPALLSAFLIVQTLQVVP